MHQETRIQYVNNRPQTRRVTITDFRFWIDVTPVWGGSGKHSAPGLELIINDPRGIPPPGSPRGDAKYDDDLSDGEGKKKKAEKDKKGWFGGDSDSDSDSDNDEKHSHGHEKSKIQAYPAKAAAVHNRLDALREWCATFVADPEKNKSLVLDKMVTGWDFGYLESTIVRWVRECGYGDKVRVSFVQTSNRIVVRPAGRAMRVWQRIRTSGVKKYAVGVARCESSCVERLIGLDHAEMYPSVPQTFPQENVNDARARLHSVGLSPSTPLGPGPRGVHYRLGMPLDLWLAGYRDPVVVAVCGRHKADERHCLLPTTHGQW